ncbi:hypothetical protein ABL78_4352 [Leptomonas seymouri]|uniref:Uncharacterized protein n=1 Tax=Leptomonas seymouri TaxID=5684 RepID=A0A0N0P5Z7_LEPSE|nr:hypothetical protein ABL78_4352 [Leptomonas seymouri]|eukprot:KPI86577.1 hypothetical protein ABL78_4352 [Leptomonas seymouri]
MCRALLHVGVAALLSTLLLLTGSHSVVAQVEVETPLTLHVLNVTLNAAGWPTDAAALDSYVSGLTADVTATICGSLPSTVSKCTAFMTSVSATASPVQVAIQASAQSDSYGAGRDTYKLFSQWAAGAHLFSLSAVAGSLPAPSYSSGKYTAPCRGALSYSFLPVCSHTETQVTTVYVKATSTALESAFLSHLCPTTSTATCTARVAVTRAADNYQIVEITGTPKGLEAVLAFVADARASYLGLSSASNAVPGEKIGDRNRQLGVTAVELHYNNVRATLFTTTENQRTYMASANMSVQCEASYNMWAIAFVAVPFLVIGLFRYVWHRGRHRAKKHERRRIVEDETRIMQGYTNPADTQAVETAPPPGVDTSALAPQWRMDENGNYYDANAGGAVTAIDAAVGNGALSNTGGGNGTAYHTWVDPETGETYQYVVDNAGAAASAADDGAQQAATGAGEDPNAVYQTYVDPETGETYQYVVDNAGAAASAADDGAQQTATGAGEDPNAVYQTYVDPETGETYQYAVDPAGGGTQDEHVADAVTEAAGADDYQTYVDPNTGEAYQYSVLANDAVADGQQYEYVDPNTGEVFPYDASAAAGGNGTAGNTYVDPNTGAT